MRYQRTGQLVAQQETKQRQADAEKKKKDSEDWQAVPTGTSFAEYEALGSGGADEGWWIALRDQQLKAEAARVNSIVAVVSHLRLPQSSSLHTLVLYQAGLRNPDGILLARSLKLMGQSCPLRRLDLTSNLLGNVSLCALLSAARCTKLEQLSLAYNDVDGTVLGAWEDEGKDNLVYLNLEGNNIGGRQKGQGAWVALGGGITKRIGADIKLPEPSPIAEPTTVQHPAGVRARSFAAPAPSSAAASACAASIAGAGVEVGLTLWQALPKTLHRLKLSSCYLRTVRPLTSAISQGRLPGLRILELDSNTMNPEEVPPLLHVSGTQVHQLSLAYNNLQLFSSIFREALVKFATNNQSVSALEITGNTLDTQTMLAVSQALIEREAIDGKPNPLRTLDIGLTSVTVAVMSGSLFDAAQHHELHPSFRQLFRVDQKRSDASPAAPAHVASPAAISTHEEPLLTPSSSSAAAATIDADSQVFLTSDPLDAFGVSPF